MSLHSATSASILIIHFSSSPSIFRSSVTDKKIKRAGAARFRSFPARLDPWWVKAIPRWRVFLSSLASFHCKVDCALMMDKDQKEALQVAKELTTKLIECRTVSPSNIADVFPNVFKIVYKTIQETTNNGEKIK